MKLCIVLVVLATAQALDCPLGSQIVGDHCEKCVAGSYDAGDNTCQACPGGKVATVEGATACTDCPIRTHSSDNRTICLPCTNGHFADTTGNEECVPCAEGHYTNQTGALACDACPAGTFQDKAGFDFCYDCPEGTFADTPGTAVCSKCPVHTFLNVKKQSECKKCPAGSDTTEEGQTICSACEEGTYGDKPGDGCKNCAAGTFTNTTGETACEGCAKGHYNLVEGLTQCKACPVGHFQNLVGQKRCEPCPPRTFGTTTGLDYCDFCPAGTFSKGSGNSVCTKCAVGHYTDKEGQEECKPCPRGFYQDEEGQNICKPCSAGTAAAKEGAAVCDMCAPGTHSSVDKAVTCDLCGRGYYQSEEGQMQCKSCLDGKITKTTGAKQPSECYWERCPPGYKYVGGQEMCKTCKPGTYSDEMNSKDCVACPLGTYTEFERASFCDECPKTHFTYTNGSDSKSDCQGPLLVGYTMKNFGGRKMEVYDTTYQFSEQVKSVRVFRGDWNLYSSANGRGNHKFISEGGELRDVQAAMNYQSGAQSATTQVNDEFCYTEKGAKYSGTRDYTVSGRSCQMWNSSHPHQHSVGLDERMNYCRNPDKSARPWCYTNDPNTRWEYCGVPACVWNRDCEVGDGSKYRGTASHTVSGSNCQNWQSDFPHPHGYHASGYSSMGVGNHNHCRNPSGESGAWCFTTYLFERWGYCRIPRCNTEEFSYYDQSDI